MTSESCGLVVRAALAALYLRGAPRSVSPPKGRWRAVASALARRDPLWSEASLALQDEGLRLEAVALDPALLDWAAAEVVRGRVLTGACPSYPARWVDVLGASAPPALWQAGDMPEVPEAVSVVGSREIERPVYEFAAGVGREAARLGLTLCSGAATGCDSAAALGAWGEGGAVVEVLPYGLSLHRARCRGALLSACAPDEGFTSAGAMERNALIYAFSPCSVVVAARFKEGGTWRGAVEAHRRRLTRLIVRQEPHDLAHRALVSLGATPLASPSSLAAAIAAAPLQVAQPQGALFGT